MNSRRFWLLVGCQGNKNSASGILVFLGVLKRTENWDFLEPTEQVYKLVLCLPSGISLVHESLYEGVIRSVIASLITFVGVANTHPLQTSLATPIIAKKNLRVVIGQMG